jgi:hypothetical protein
MLVLLASASVVSSIPLASTIRILHDVQYSECQIPFECEESNALIFWHRSFHLNFSTPCMLNVNNTGIKKGSIMK